MMAARLFVHIIKRSEDEFELAGLSEDKQLWCNLPLEYQNLKHHKVLLSKSTIKSAVSAIKPINGYRKVGVKVDEEIKMEYFDEDENLCYKNIPLEESYVDNINPVGMEVNKSKEEIFLIKRIKELESKLNLSDEVKLHEVEKKFILDKFNKTQDPTDWLRRFESECTRHNVTKETNMIEILRFFLNGSPKDWYEGNLKKIGLFNWPEWQNSFFAVFKDKGWRKIRAAYNYKYLGGSLIDYALAKEKLCLDAENNGTVLSRINMIVVGLPLDVQNKLDREEITSVDKLYTELRKIDDSYNIKIKITNDIKGNEKRIAPARLNSTTTNKKINTDNQNKKPCYMCEALGWPNRYHPTSDCRNKNLYISRKESNLHEANDEAETMKIELDNKSLN